MRHPTDGTLRRLVDEPVGVADADREHVASCPVCLAELAAARRDAAMTGSALDVEATPDVDAGWQRLSHAAAIEGRRRRTASGRWRAALRSPVVAAAGVVALLAGASVAAAADWLPIFHTERIAPVSITQADLVALPDLSRYGTLRVIDQVDIRQVAGATAAEEATGLAVPRLTGLPQGVVGEPAYRVGDRVSAVFTFSAERTARAAEATGETLPPPPAGLDGSRFRLVAGPGVAAVWSEARGLPSLVVARAVAPTAYSSGIPFPTVRDYLLSLPGVPEQLASQLRGFSGDATTLPVPLPAGQVTTSSADVGGTPATVFTTRDGLLAGVVWVDDGVITAVAGSVSDDEVLSVARDLRWRR